MRALRNFILEQGVRGHLYASLFSCPFLGRLQQFPPDSPPPQLLTDVPSLKISDSTRYVASIRMRTQPNLGEAYEGSAPVLRNEFNQWQVPRRLTIESGEQFLSVLLGRRLRPKRRAHPRQRPAILRPRNPDSDIPVCSNHVRLYSGLITPKLGSEP